MGMKQKQVGGGPATGLANDFVGLLQSGLRTGTFGTGGATSQFANANPLASTTGIAGVMNDILAGGAGQIGGSLAQLIQTQQANDVAGLRSRFGVGGGTAFGTPAAYAESTYRAQAAPQITQAIGGLQEGLLGQLLPIISGLSMKGIPQAEITQQASPWLQAAQIGLPILGTVAGAFAGNPELGAMLGGLFGKGASNAGSSAGVSPYYTNPFGNELYGIPGTPGVGLTPGAPFQFPMVPNAPYLPVQ